MTRINVVSVQELCDKHLLAEYRELPRVFRLARNCPDAPKEYTLGTGHVKFFYDKLSFLARRFTELCTEGKVRGFNIAYDTLPQWAEASPAHLWNDYEPTPEALAINRARIAERISQFKQAVPTKPRSSRKLQKGHEG